MTAGEPALFGRAEDAEFRPHAHQTYAFHSRGPPP